MPGKLESVSIGGHSYSLKHLLTRTHVWPIELRNKVKVDIRVEANFSCHCYSRKPKLDEQYSPDQVILDGKQTRLFDQTRYQLSLGLPAVIEQLPSSKVFETGFHNLVRIVLPDSVDAGSDYLVFMALTKIGKRNIKLMVESAYPSELMEDRKKYTKSIRFIVAIRKAYEGR